MKHRPRYPIYIPSKGRADILMTAQMFDADGVNYRVVVEPSQVELYKAFRDRLLVLPEDSKGLVYSRNWIKQHSISEGHARHWQFDDDIRRIIRINKGHKISAASNVAICAMEDFVDRYENVALSSFNSQFFVPLDSNNAPPFYLNMRCYTVFLMLNSLPNTWRHRFNEDTDMTLQVLADGWCTVLFNAFTIETPGTMSFKGGQTDIYVNDGRLHMARQLERVWPYVVTTKRRFKRPQHAVRDTWKKFDTPLKLKPGIDLSKMKPNNYGMVLKETTPGKNKELRKLMKHENSRSGSVGD